MKAIVAYLREGVVNYEQCPSASGVYLVKDGQIVDRYINDGQGQHKLFVNMDWTLWVLVDMND